MRHFYGKLILAIEALRLCLPFANPRWSPEVKYPCRYFGHRLNAIEGEKIYCSVAGCGAYTPYSKQKLNEIFDYGFALS